MLLVVGVQRLAREIFYELARAEQRAPVGMRRIGRLGEAALQEALRIVLGEVHLLEHDLLLALELGGHEGGVDGDVGEQRGGGAQAREGDDEVVMREVVRRERVAVAAEAFDLGVDRPRWPRRRSLEEHVLEIVREPQLGGRLVASAHAQPELHGDDVTGAVLLADDDDAVGQDVPRRSGGAACSGRERSRAPDRGRG